MAPPTIISDQNNPKPVPDTPCWVQYGPVSILRNFEDLTLNVAKHVASSILSKENIQAIHYFRIARETHLHIDQPRNTSIGFVLNDHPIRVYTRTKYNDFEAVTCLGGDMFILDVKTLHAARAILNQPWTIFISVTSSLSHGEIVERFSAYAQQNLKVYDKFPARVQPDEDISSLYMAQSEVSLP